MRLRDIHIVGRWDIRVHEVRIVNIHIIRVVNGIHKIQVPVKEEECHIQPTDVLAALTSLVEHAVHRKLRAIPAQRHRALRGQLLLLALLAGASDGEQMSGQSQVAEFLGSFVPLLDNLLGSHVHRRALEQPHKQLSQNLGGGHRVQPLAAQHLRSNGTVKGEAFHALRRVIPDEQLAGIDVAVVVDQDLCILDQVVRQQPRGALLGQGQALLPLASAGVHLQGRGHVPFHHQLISLASGNQVILDLLLNVAQ
mmetsp:Transcript_13570/g.30116  ORF Transcript_13570/g.30116 Transcript_13570/m.30116 type:complete len:253 (+) Transcript_13570:437-1195(+)